MKDALSCDGGVHLDGLCTVHEGFEVGVDLSERLHNDWLGRNDSKAWQYLYAFSTFPSIIEALSAHAQTKRVERRFLPTILKWFKLDGFADGV